MGDSDTGNGHRILEGQEHPHPGALLDRQFQQVLPLEPHLAASHLIAGMAHDDIGQRALAGAVGSHQGVGLTQANAQVHPFEDGLSRDRCAQVLDLEIECLLTHHFLAR